MSLFSSVPKTQKRHGCRWFHTDASFGTAETRSFHCTRMYDGKKRVIVPCGKPHWDIRGFSHLCLQATYISRMQKWLRISKKIIQSFVPVRTAKTRSTRTPKAITDYTSPAFSNCFFSILLPTHALNAATSKVPPTITTGIHDAAEVFMVSI